MMKRAPKGTPAVGDVVEFRKNGETGTLVWVNSLNWCSVDWRNRGPVLCHLFELRTTN